MKNKHLPKLIQLTRFGMVGALAAIVHISMVILQVEAFAVAPLIANVWAFLTAFIVSFFGHQHWTFGHVQTSVQKNMPRFFLIAILGFILNQTLFYILLDIVKIYYVYSLILVLMIVPGFVFMFSKYWAFKDTAN